MATHAEPAITAPQADLAGEAGRRGARAMWAAGLVVVTGAGVLTAHGLTEVAIGSTVGARIAWLYPVITDGLALVAYTATTRLATAGRRYAWSVVVLAAGLSALAQAVFLAGGAPQATPLLRGVVGAWSAVAAAIAAHLLFLIRTDQRVDTAASTAADTDASTRDPAVVQPQPSVVPGSVQGGPARVSTGSDVPDVQPPVSNPAGASPLVLDAGTGGGREPGLRRALSPIDRARTAAMLHHREVGRWPSARQLAALAQVGRGTAHTAIQQLAAGPPALHLVTKQSTAEGSSTGTRHQS